MSMLKIRKCKFVLNGDAQIFLQGEGYIIMLLRCLKVIASLYTAFQSTTPESVFTDCDIAARKFTRCGNHNSYVKTQMRLNDTNSKAKGKSVGNVLRVIGNASFF